MPDVNEESARLLGGFAVGLSPCRQLPPPDGNVAIDRVQFHHAASPPRAFRRDHLGAGTAEGLIDQMARIGEGFQHHL